MVKQILKLQKHFPPQFQLWIGPHQLLVKKLSFLKRMMRLKQTHWLVEY